MVIERVEHLTLNVYISKFRFSITDSIVLGATHMNALVVLSLFFLCVLNVEDILVSFKCL